MAALGGGAKVNTSLLTLQKKGRGGIKRNQGELGRGQEREGGISRKTEGGMELQAHVAFLIVQWQSLLLWLWLYSSLGTQRDNNNKSGPDHFLKSLVDTDVHHQEL